MNRADAINALVHRDGITAEDARQRIREAIQAALEAGENGEGDPWEVWEEETGLEPDYFEAWIV